MPILFPHAHQPYLLPTVAEKKKRIAVKVSVGGIDEMGMWNRLIAIKQSSFPSLCSIDGF